MAKKTEKVRLCKGHNSPLLNCLGDMRESEFYISWSKFTDGRVPYCKTCVNKIYEYYLQETGSDKTALYFTLMKLDIPFIEEVYNSIAEKKAVTISTYITTLQRRTTCQEIWSDFTATDVKLDENEVHIQTVDDKKRELDNLERTWGKQDCVEDYDFLEDTFKRYTQGVDFINPQQEDLYKDLCRDRLLLRKINDNRYSGEESLDKVQNRISKTMAILKLDQFEENKPKTISEQLMFTKIAQIEQTKPADLYKEPKKYKDFNKIKMYYKDLVLRPLLNTLVGSKDFNIDIDDVGKYNLDEESE